MKKLRQKLAFYIVRLAVKIYPRSPEVARFYSTICTDAMISGRAICINSTEFLPNKAASADQHMTTGSVSGQITDNILNHFIKKTKGG